MSLSQLLPQTVSLVRYTASGEDLYGNPDVTGTTVATSRARLEQLGSRENDTDRMTVTDQWRVFLPAGTQLRAGDELLEGGRRFRVEGTPEVVYGASSAHHVEARLTYAGDVTFDDALSSDSNYDTALYDLAVYA